MSEKPKVYQGVRVKITVKELLQQRRAHQAASGATGSMKPSLTPQAMLSGGNSIHHSDPIEPTPAGLFFEPEPISSTSNYFQPREFSTCVSCEENPSCLDQIFDSYLQTETLPESLLNSTQGVPHYFPDSFQAAPFCFTQNLTPGSPDSSSLSGSFDSSYSPAQLPSYAAESYTCPPPLDPLAQDCPAEDYAYHHLPAHSQYSCFSPATTSVCYCTSCEAQRLDAFRAAEYFSHGSTDCSDFVPLAATSGDFYKRESSCDVCYS